MGGKRSPDGSVVFLETGMRGNVHDSGIDRKTPAGHSDREKGVFALKHIRSNVLLVDDDPQILQLVRGALTTSGYSILASTDAMDGQEMLEDLHLRIDLLLTDVHMPYMSGPELARKGVRSRPSLGVLFMSGDPTSRANFRQEDQLLQKPFTMDELLCQVEQVVTSHNGFAREAETLPKAWNGVERRKANSIGLNLARAASS